MTRFIEVVAAQIPRSTAPGCTAFCPVPLSARPHQSPAQNFIALKWSTWWTNEQNMNDRLWSRLCSESITRYDGRWIRWDLEEGSEMRLIYNWLRDRDDHNKHHFGAGRDQIGMATGITRTGPVAVRMGSNSMSKGLMGGLVTLARLLHGEKRNCHHIGFYEYLPLARTCWWQFDEVGRRKEWTKSPSSSSYFSLFLTAWPFITMFGHKLSQIGFKWTDHFWYSPDSIHR